MAVGCVYSLVAWLLFESPIGKAGIQPSGMAVVVSPSGKAVV